MDAELFQLALKVGRTLQSKRRMLATAESCTGGWIAKVLTDVAGSSAWFERGYVTYSDAAKMSLLDVSETVLMSDGAVSEAVARAMAVGALRHSKAHMAVAVTGIAGPEGGSAQKPAGTVWFAWADGETVDASVQKFPGDRNAVRRQTVVVALDGVLERL